MNVFLRIFGGVLPLTILLSGCGSLFVPSSLSEVGEDLSRDFKIDDEAELTQNEDADSELLASIALNDSSKEFFSGQKGDSSWERIEQSLLNSREDFADLPGLDSAGSDIEGKPGNLPPVIPDSTESPKKANDKVIRIVDAPPENETPRFAPLISRPKPGLPMEVVIPSVVDSELFSESVVGSSSSSISWKDSLEATIAHLKAELESGQLPNSEARHLKDWFEVLTSINEDQSIVDLGAKLKRLKNSLPPHHYAALTQLINAVSAKEIGAPVPVNQLVATLRDAIRNISSSANLIVNNATLCKEVDGFGKTVEFQKTRFEVDDEVLLYCELENFSEKMLEEQGKHFFESQFDAQVEFVDQNKGTLFVKSYADLRDRCANRRDDFHLFFRIRMPNLDPGDYSIQIRIHDKFGQKKASLIRPLTFSIGKAKK